MKKVLIVDDEPHIVAYLESLLQDSGYRTVSASNGALGLEIVDRERPDLIILDLMMPRKTGIEFHRSLVRRGDLRCIPVIVVSAAPDRELAVTDPVATFDKPIDPGAFLSAVRRALAPGDPE